MPWLKLSLPARKTELDDLTARLESAGAQAVTIEDADDHPLFDHVDGDLPVWDNNIVSALFEGAGGRDGLLSRLQPALGEQALTSARIEELPDTDWERSWLERYEAIDYGHGLWVCPTWREPPDATATNLFLDPGLAFGSGTHETTGMCLRWLAANPPVGKKVIDYGCGSGILAIAALKLGANSAIGVDLDPKALQASRANAERNGVSGPLQLHFPDELAKPLKADLIFANILANTLVELKEDMLSMRRDQGILVLSGILAEQAGMVSAAYGEDNTIDQVRDGDWIMMTVTEKRT